MVDVGVEFGCVVWWQFDYLRFVWFVEIVQVDLVGGCGDVFVFGLQIVFDEGEVFGFWFVYDEYVVIWMWYCYIELQCFDCMFLVQYVVEGFQVIGGVEGELFGSEWVGQFFWCQVQVGSDGIGYWEFLYWVVDCCGVLLFVFFFQFCVIDKVWMVLFY